MIDYSQVPSPSFVLDESLLRKNLELIDSVQQQANVTIILAFKGFAMWSVFSIVREYLSGATASSLSEARLCFEEMKVKAHTYSPAYLDDEMDEIISYSSHITFNSITQYQRFYKKVIGKVSCGIRVNPEFSIVEYDITQVRQAADWVKWLIILKANYLKALKACTFTRFANHHLMI